VDIKKQFGLRVRKLRKDRNLSQEALALLADIDRTYIPSIEKGERNVSITIAAKIAKALTISIKELFDF